MKKVSRGFSGENLCDKLATEISSINTVPGNVTLKPQDAFKSYKGFVLTKPKQEYKRFHMKLKSAAGRDNKFWWIAVTQISNGGIG